jgi:hypothetical protein
LVFGLFELFVLLMCSWFSSFFFIGLSLSLTEVIGRQKDLDLHCAKGELRKCLAREYFEAAADCIPSVAA